MNDKKERLISSIKHLAQMLEVDYLSYQSGIDRLYEIASHYQEKSVPKKEEPDTPLERLIRACREAGKEDLAKAWEEMRKWESKVHVCSARGHYICLLEAAYGKGNIYRFAESDAPKEDDPELLLTVGQMKELFDNLLAEGFAKGEAASIVAQVARG